MSIFSRPFCLVGALSLLALGGLPANGDTFGDGDNAFAIEFMTIGSPGNAPDDAPNPAGAVPYSYRIGKYEIPEDAIRKANAESALDGAPLGLTLDTRGPDKPATSITWFEAARFVNWLNTSTDSVPAYKFDDTGAFQLWLPTDAGYDANNLYRNKLATYFLPSIDEWHKAAYYDPVAGHYWDYPTGSDAIPDGIDFVGDLNFEAVFDDGGNQLVPNDIMNVGISSPYGTFSQGGNVAEWEETSVDRLNNSPFSGRGFRGGSWGTGQTVLLAENRNGIAPSAEITSFGFRVGSIVPEPNALFLIGSGLIIFALMTRKARNSI